MLALGTSVSQLDRQTNTHTNKTTLMHAYNHCPTSKQKNPHTTRPFPSLQVNPHLFPLDGRTILPPSQMGSPQTQSPYIPLAQSRITISRDSDRPECTTQMVYYSSLIHLIATLSSYLPGTLSLPDRPAPNRSRSVVFACRSLIHINPISEHLGSICLFFGVGLWGSIHPGHVHNSSTSTCLHTRLGLAITSTAPCQAHPAPIPFRPFPNPRAPAHRSG